VTNLPENISLAVRDIKSAIVKAQIRVAANANAEMLLLYFGIGRYVSYKTQTEKWGTRVIDTISAQLQKEMPGLRGYGARGFVLICEDLWATCKFNNRLEAGIGNILSSIVVVVL
jgi:hypothetical protein